MVRPRQAGRECFNRLPMSILSGGCELSKLYRESGGMVRCSQFPFGYRFTFVVSPPGL